MFVDGVRDLLMLQFLKAARGGPFRSAPLKTKFGERERRRSLM